MKTIPLALVKRYPLVVFLILTFLISWLPWLTGGEGIFVFGPSLAGAFVTALVYGKEGMRDLLQRALRWQAGAVWWVLALFLPGLLTLIAIFGDVALGGKWPPFTFFKEQWYLAPVFFLITMVGGPLGEEFGWRGFALPNLQRRWGPLVASLIIGVIWGIWHLPVFLMASGVHTELGLARLPIYVAAEMGLSILMTWIYNKTRGSLLLGGLIYHNADNFWGSVLMTGVTMGAALQGNESSTLDLSLWEASALVGILAAIVVALVTRGRLGLADHG